MAEETKDPSVSVMLDAIRRRELLKNNLSPDDRWIEVDSEIAGAPLRIRILLPQDKWSTPSELLASPPIALRYESRMESWNLDYMVEAFDAICGRHPAISGPWVTVIRTEDRRSYHGRDAWDMTLVASMFRTQAGLKTMRRPSESETDATEVGEDVVAVEIHTETQFPHGARMKEVALEFHRGEGGYTEVVRFGTGDLLHSEFLHRVLGNVLWGSPPSSSEVEDLRARVTDLVDLFLTDGGCGDLGGPMDAIANRDESPDA